MKDFKKVLKFLKPYKIYAVLNVFFNLLTIIFSIFSLGMIIPFLNLIFGVDQLVESAPAMSLSKDDIMDNLYYQMSSLINLYGHEKVLIGISIAIIILFLFKNTFRYMAMWVIAPLRNGVIKDLRLAIHKKILVLPLSFFSEKKKGDVIARATSDVQDVEWTIMGSIEMLFRDSITIIAYMTALFWFNTKLTIVMLLILPIAGLIIGKIGKTLRKKSLKAQTMMGGLLSYFEEAISGLRIIKGFNAINSTHDKFSEHNRNYTKVTTSVMRRGDLSAPISEFFGIIIMSVVLWYGGMQVLDQTNSMNGEGFVFYVVLFSQVIPGVKSFASGYYRVQKGTASAKRIFEIIEADEVITEKANAVSKENFESSIKYENLSFKYEDIWVLKDINLEIEKGKTVALVGASGGGKSTMADLLPRFYDTVKGAITIDNIDTRDIKINDVRELMGIVTQESILFNDTVFNNIAFGKDDPKMEDVISAAKAANAHEFIESMSDGYNTLIGDRGSKLSGGQRQRITIARAILKNPPIMILDEATSALDTESEKLVQDALNNLMKNRTSLVIAHRLSTIQNANKIVVIDQGEIKEFGSHTELISKNGIYKKLHDLQSFA